METWLETVCSIAANDLGTRANAVRFMLNDWMDVVVKAYNDHVSAETFAIDFVETIR